MKTLNRITLLALMALSISFAQINTLSVTTTSAAVTANTLRIPMTSVTGMTAGDLSSGTVGTMLWVVDIGQNMGEAMTVTGISGSIAIVSRTQGKTVAHASGAMVLYGKSNLFKKTDPTGSCVAATIEVSPFVNTINGNQWLCSAKTLTWVSGWGNTTGSPQALSATATASVAGATAIAGPFLEISGTNAITSFTMSTGWNGQGFCAYPTGAFTGTATNNIAKAFTAVADRVLCFKYDAVSSKFSPQY